VRLRFVVFAFALLMPLAPAAALPSGSGQAQGPEMSTAAASVQTPAAPTPEASADVAAPPVLPLFAAALGMLGWRLGRGRKSP
jgi:hypothetical protein